MIPMLAIDGRARHGDAEAHGGVFHWMTPTRAARILVPCLLTAACTEPAAPPVSAWEIRAAGGDGQRGIEGSLAPEPLVVVVVDKPTGGPAAGVRVRWEAISNASLDSWDPATGPDGRATARIRLGATPGEALARATAGTLPAVDFRLTVEVAAGEIEPGEIRALTFPTFDGSGEVVHPDHARTPPWLFPEQLAITPYPNGNSGFELPSLFSGRFATAWLLSPGVPNPVIRAPVIGYLSDPDILYAPDQALLYLYYRAVTDHNLIYLTRTPDGVSWSAPELVVAARNHDIISPSVVRRGPFDWWMWSVNGGLIGCSAASTFVEARRSMDGVHWGPPALVELDGQGLSPWHVDVQWIEERGEYWALFNAKQAGSCTTPALFLATSPDGLDWTTAPTPVLAKGAIPAFKDIVYRSTFRYLAASDEVLLWYSGARFDSGRWVWSAAAGREPRADLFEGRQAALPLRFEPAPAPLIDWP